MYTKEEILRLLKAKKPALEQKYALSELGLFGSFARGNFNDQSDIDILVDFHQSVDGFQLIHLTHELEDLFNYKVDVVSRGGIRKPFLPYIEKNLIHV